MSKKIIALISDDFEDLELWYPVHRLREEEGVTVDVVGEEKGKTYIGKYGVPCVSDYRFDEINPDEYDGILVPGGWAPDKLRRFPAVLDMVRAMDKAGKPIGEICHAGWVLISAGILKGKNVTSTIWKTQALSGMTPRPLSTAILFRPGVRRIFRST